MVDELSSKKGGGMNEEMVDAARDRLLMNKWDRVKGFTIGTVGWEPWPVEANAIVFSQPYKYEILWDDINSPTKLMQ